MAGKVSSTEKLSSVTTATNRVPQAHKTPGFFSWILPALRTPRTLKTLVRCCAALAAALVLMVSNRTLDNMGQAGFFTAFVDGIPQALQYQKLIFKGHFLDPRSSAVYGAFFFIGTFALGVLRAYIPKFTLVSIFGSIVLDVMCSYGPLFPTSNYTLAKIFLIPTSYYVAIAIASLVLIFPVSLNHVWITSLQHDFLQASSKFHEFSPTNLKQPLSKILSFQSKALESIPSDHATWTELTTSSQAARQKLLASTQGLLGQIGVVDLEFSVGRLGPGDLKRISRELKSIVFRASALYSFLEFVNRSNTANAAECEAEPFVDGAGDKTGYWDRYTILQKEIWQHEMKHGHDFDSLVPILAESSSELRAACSAAITGLTAWFDDCNHGRWTKFFSKYDKVKGDQRHAVLVQQLAAVQRELEQYRELHRKKVFQPFEKFFDPVTGQRLKQSSASNTTGMFAARSLYICLVFSFSLDAFAERIAQVMSLIIDIDGKRPKPRIWAPSGFGKLGRKIMSKRDIDRQVVPLAIGTSHDPTSFRNHTEDINDEDEDDKVEVIFDDKCMHKDPDALPPTSTFGRCSLILGKIFKFFKSPEGIFGLRHAVVSIALWIPSVCSTTAWFYYGNRGVWGLIMAQAGLAVYAGDQIAGYVIRVAGTIAGLLVGMAAWYIGAGHGPGNPYGIVIATTACSAPLYLGRIAAPHQQLVFWIMTGVTTVFVVGYSWIDTHLPVLVSAGAGVAIGWKRALLVIIGFTAGFIVMLFPRPTSSRTLVRRTLAATAGELGIVLADEVEALLAEETRARQGHYEKVTFVGAHSDQKVSLKERRVRRIGQKALDIAVSVSGLIFLERILIYD
ncbi:hypothetical protein C0993_000760 [Termitomyces sp. T159_Od127]|nr:hypothetical protein C0993_000760 [Termitomyces sp. T159_Od127]